MPGFGVYDSEREAPDLPQCLERARRDMESMYKIRAKLFKVKSSFLNEWKWVRYYVFKERMLASEWDRKANMLRLCGELPQAHILIRVAIAFWLEAKVALNHHLHMRSWSALVRCNYYLGMCSGHESKKERSSRGGRHTGRRLAPLRAMVLQTLNGMKTDSHATKQDIWGILIPMMRTFRAPPPSNEPTLEQKRRVARGSFEIYEGTFDRVYSIDKSATSKTTNPEKLIMDWTRKDAVIRAEIMRISRAGPNTRARRSKKLNPHGEPVAASVDPPGLQDQA